MAKETSVSIVLRAVDRVSDVLDKVSGKFKPLTENTKKATAAFSAMQTRTESLRKNLNQIGGDMQSAGKKMMIGFGAPLAAATAASVYAFAKFDGEMRKIQAILPANAFGAKSLGEGMAEISLEVQKMAGKLPVPIEQLSEALFDTVHSGFSAQDSLIIVGEAAKLATAGFANTTDATKALNVIMDAYHLKASDAADISAKLFYLHQKGQITVQAVSENMKGLATQAANLGIPFDQVVAGLDAAASSGLSAEESISGMQALLKSLTKPSSLARAEGHRLGGQFSLQAVKAEGLGVVFQKLAASSHFTGGSLGRLTKSTEAQAVFMAIAKGRATEFNEALVALSDKAAAIGAEQEGFNTAMGGLGNSFDITKNKVVILAEKVGKELKPALDLLLAPLNKFLDFMDEHPKIAVFGLALLAVGAAIGALVALGGTLLVFASFGITAGAALAAGWAAVAGAFTAVILPVLAVVAAIAAVVAIGYVLYDNWEQIKIFSAAVWESPLVHFVRWIFFLDEIIGLIGLLWDGMKALGGWLASVFVPIMDGIKAAFVWAVNITEKIIGLVDKFGLGSGIAKASTLGGVAQPSGAPIAAAGEVAKSVTNNSQTNHAKVDVNFSDLPRGTKVSSETTGGGMFGMNLGYQGAFE